MFDLQLGYAVKLVVAGLLVAYLLGQALMLIAMFRARKY